MDGKEQVKRDWELTPRQREEFRRRIKAGFDRREGAKPKKDKGVNDGD